MISKHNSNNNKLQQQMRKKQNLTDDSDASITSITKNINKETTDLQLHPMIVNKKEDSDDDSDEELTPLHERLKWDNESDEEENSEQIERNRMSCNAMIKQNDNNKKRYKKNNQNNNQQTKPFSGITKISPTIIVNASNQAHSNLTTNDIENNTSKVKTKINNVKFGDDIRQDPQENSTRIFFQNVNGLEFSSTSHTLLATCIGMQDNQIDIACLAETNTN